MRFVHTADWQIGMKAAHAGEAGARVREERLVAARRVGEVARAAGAEFVLLAGDTFEDNGVDRLLVQRVIDTLVSFEIPVYVLPGNHDPLAPGSVWDHPAWRAAPAVHVLRERAPIEVPGGLLLPSPAHARHSTEDPTAWMAAVDTPAGVLRVGVAHGTVEGVHRDEPDYPIAREAVSRGRLDYLALGHWHSTTLYSDSGGATRMAYSGTHEPTRFGERDSGNVLVVDLPSPGGRPELRVTRTGGLSWLSFEARLREVGDLARLRAEIEALPHPSTTLVHVRIGGVLHASERDELMRIGDLVGSRFLFGRVSVENLRPSSEDNAWVQRLPAGAVREAAARLRELADPAYQGTRPEGASPEVAAWALLELYELLDDVSAKEEAKGGTSR